MFRKVLSAALCAVVALTSTVTVGAVSKENLSAPAAVLMESETGKVLFEKNPHEQRPCASVTKVMTLLLVFEAIDAGRLSLDDTITASEHAASMGGSDIWLEPGETMSADDMIKATVVASANDAAVALAETLCGSEDAFVEQMNKRAKELGMADTVFKNCNGLDEEGHVTSAYDVALMSRELIKHEKVFDYTSIWLDTLRDGKTQIVNTNKLLKTYNGITGLKTGTTDDAGCCMSATATRDGMTLISVVIGCPTGKERFADAAALLDDGFANYFVEELQLPKELPNEIEVEGGMDKSVGLQCKVNASIVRKKTNENQIKTEISLPKSVEAPIKENQKIGTLVYTLDGKKIESCDITAKNEVFETSFGRIFSKVFDGLTKL